MTPRTTLRTLGAPLRRGGPLLAALLSLPLLGGACSPNIHATVNETSRGFRSESFTLQVVSTNVGGKNVYIPSTLVVPGGREVTLSLFNTTDIAHGFAIAGLGVEAVIQPGVETEVVLPASEGGRIHRIHCQLHPPHRNATLVVLPAD